MDHGLAVHPAEERADDVGVDYAGERVALLGKAPDVVAQGLAWLLLAILEVPRIVRAQVRALKVADEHLPEVCLVADRVGGQELQPGTDVLSQADWEVLNDEAVVVCSSGLACKPVVLQPHTRVRVPGIFYDVHRRPKV